MFIPITHSTYSVLLKQSHNDTLTLTINKPSTNHTAIVRVCVNPSILLLLHACRECDQLPCWLPRDQQVLHQRWIWGICCAQTRKHASEGSILALKPRADITRSQKQGYQWPQKELLSSKKFQKKKLITDWWLATQKVYERFGVQYSETFTNARWKILFYTRLKLNLQEIRTQHNFFWVKRVRSNFFWA